MDNTKSARQKEKNVREKELEELKLTLEKQIAISIWIQAIGQIMEAILVLKLLAISEKTEGEQTLATGVVIQMVGQIVESIGVTKEITQQAPGVLPEAQRIAITGDWLQSIGAAIEAIGGEMVLTEEQQAGRTGFVP
ncbi:DUF6944 family repetitive protein [Bacillus sp. FJAT-27245]|uniref:DUF6944 family repetitive protein n=1 Tax=Bacillus sp. FJAT-27245 TaxID=1684144 RepID=UPI0006A7D139|nr:hypothetical protein [Bacillus sp. FJAT-27245]